MSSESCETVDELAAFGLRVCQPRHGYRFSLDPLILCDFARTPEGANVIDLGTGCGIIPLVIASTVPGVSIIGVEHQETMAELATRNVHLNALEERISILHQDVLALRGRFEVSSFDAVVANPPYRRPGTGKISPKSGRDLARHESTAGLTDFLAAGKYLVKQGGSISIIYHPVRLPELFAEAHALKLNPVRLRMVHGHAGLDAGMFLVELAKGRRHALQVMPPLFVYDGKGNYSEEMARINGLSSARGREPRNG